MTGRKHMTGVAGGALLLLAGAVDPVLAMAPCGVSAPGCATPCAHGARWTEHTERQCETVLETVTEWVERSTCNPCGHAAERIPVTRSVPRQVCRDVITRRPVAACAGAVTVHGQGVPPRRGYHGDFVIPLLYVGAND